MQTGLLPANKRVHWSCFKQERSFYERVFGRSQVLHPGGPESQDGDQATDRRCAPVEPPSSQHSLGSAPQGLHPCGPVPGWGASCTCHCLTPLPPPGLGLEEPGQMLALLCKVGWESQFSSFYLAKPHLWQEGYSKSGLQIGPRCGGHPR